MRNVRTRYARWAALVAVVALLATACGSEGDGDDAAPTETTTETAAAYRDGIPKVGYDLIQPGGPGFSLEPAKQPTNTNDGLMYAIYARLLRPTASGGLEPDLAEKVTITDKNTIDVELKPGLTFHDGSALDAAAVKASLEEILNSGSNTLGAAFASLKTIDVTGPLSLRLNVPDGSAPSWHDSFLGSWQTSIAKAGTNYAQPVGSGPMRVASFTPQERLVLERFDGFHDADAVSLAGMDLINVSAEQPQSGIAALKSGQIDIVLTEVGQIPSLGGQYVHLTQTTPDRLSWAMICKRDAPLNDPKVRQALNKAIDRDAVNDAVFAGTGSPATEVWPEGNRFFEPDLADVLAYDPAAAKQLLTDAGHPDGIDVDLFVLPNRSSPEVAEVIEQQFAAVGIRATIINSPNYVADFLQPQKSGLGLIPSISNGRQRLTSFSGTGIGNACAYADPELDALVAELKGVTDSSDEAVEIWSDINDIITNDALGVFILWGSLIGAYDEQAFGAEPVPWPIGSYIFPDPFHTAMAEP